MMRDKIEQSLSDADTSKIYFSFGQKMEKSKLQSQILAFQKKFCDSFKNLFG